MGKSQVFPEFTGGEHAGRSPELTNRCPCPDRGAADDVRGADLRSPAHRRQRGRHLPAQDQGSGGGSPRAAARPVGQPHPHTTHPGQGSTSRDDAGHSGTGRGHSSLSPSAVIGAVPKGITGIAPTSFPILFNEGLVSHENLPCSGPTTEWHCLSRAICVASSPSQHQTLTSSLSYTTGNCLLLLC